MSLDPKKFREFVLQILYAESMSGQVIDNKGVMGILKITKKLAISLQEYASQIVQKFDQIDKTIAKLSKEWSLERISILERQILRFGLFELEKKELDNSVIISEMIRLCKKFSTDAASEFIHALLDASIKGKAVVND